MCASARTLMHTEEHISTDTQTHNPNTGTNGCARTHEYTFTRCLSLTQECVFAHRELIIDACSAQKHSMQANTHTHAIHQPLLAQSSHMHAHVYVRARTYKCATLKGTQKALITPIPRRAQTHTHYISTSFTDTDVQAVTTQRRTHPASFSLTM